MWDVCVWRWCAGCVRCIAAMWCSVVCGGRVCGCGCVVVLCLRVGGCWIGGVTAGMDTAAFGKPEWSRGSGSTAAGERCCSGCQGMCVCVWDGICCAL